MWNRLAGSDTGCRLMRRRPTHGRGLLLLAATIAVASPVRAGTGTVASPRLVVLFAPCTVTTRTLSPYVPGVPYTPHLARFAAQGVVFERHQTEAGSSGIAYASLFSGTQAPRHGVFRHPHAVSRGVKLIGEHFAEAGYEVFYFSRQHMADARFGYARGAAAANRLDEALTRNQPRFLAILEHLRADPDYRAFVYTAFPLTHGPYTGRKLKRFARQYPAELPQAIRGDLPRLKRLYLDNHFGLSWNTEGTRRRLGLSGEEFSRLTATIDVLYRAGVSLLDRRFGTLVEAIDAAGLRDASLIAFTADHGEVLSRENALFHWSHSLQLAPEVLNVPLIVRAPGLAPGRVASTTRSIDVMPTLLGLAGLPPAKADGIDLSAALRAGRPLPSLRAFSHTSVLPRAVVQQMADPEKATDWARVAAIYPDESAQHVSVALREGDAFYVWRRVEGDTWGAEVFDLAADPDVTTNRYDAARAEHVAAFEDLRTYKARLVQAFDAARGAGRVEPPPDEAEALRGLGYIQ